MTATERRRKLRNWNNLKRRVARAPHGEKKRRESELRQFILRQLQEEVAV